MKLSDVSNLSDESIRLLNLIAYDVTFSYNVTWALSSLFTFLFVRNVVEVRFRATLHNELANASTNRQQRIVDLLCSLLHFTAGVKAVALGTAMHRVYWIAAEMLHSPGGCSRVYASWAVCPENTWYLFTGRHIVVLPVLLIVVGYCFHTYEVWKTLAGSKLWWTVPTVFYCMVFMSAVLFGGA